jgi:hypothetical protein
MKEPSWTEIVGLWASAISMGLAAKKTIVAMVASIILLGGCAAPPSSGPERAEKKAGAEQVDAKQAPRQKPAEPAPAPKRDLYSLAEVAPPPEYRVAFADKVGEEFYSVGVITKPTGDKAALGAIAFEEARKRNVSTIFLFAFESESALRQDGAFGGAQLERNKRRLTVH